MTITSIRFGNTLASQTVRAAAPAAQQQPVAAPQADTVMFGGGRKKAGVLASLAAAAGLLLSACASQSEPINLEITKLDGTTRSTTATVGTSALGSPAIYASGDTLWGNGDTELVPILARNADGPDVELTVDGDNIADVVPTGDNTADIRAEYENEDGWRTHERKGNIAKVTVQGDKVTITDLDGKKLVSANVPPETSWKDVAAAAVPAVIEALTGQQPQFLSDRAQLEQEQVLKDSEAITRDNLSAWAQYASAEVAEAYQNGGIDNESH